MEVGEDAVPDLRHPGLREPQVTRDSVLDTAHCRDHLCKEIIMILKWIELQTDLPRVASAASRTDCAYPRWRGRRCIQCGCVSNRGR